MLNAVLDGGVNLIDTSPDYGPSEEMIGEAIAGAATSTWSRDAHSYSSKARAQGGRRAVLPATRP